MPKGAINQLYPPDRIDGRPRASENVNSKWGSNVITINADSVEMNTNRDHALPTNKIHPVKPPQGAVASQLIDHGCYFNDGVRRIDYVLVYNTLHKSTHQSTIAETRRKYFLQKLEQYGINMETEEIEEEGETLVFIKVNAPFDILCEVADHIKIEKPLKLHDEPVKLKHHQLAEAWSKFFNCYYCTKVGRDHPNEDKKAIYYPFDNKDIDLFDIKDENTFFSDIQRNEITWEILQQIPNHPEDPKLRGIEGLVEHGIFESAYPIHENFSTDYSDQKAKSGETLRQLLRRTWSGWQNILSIQPIHKIRNYFGEKIGFYFLFMDFYTKQLVFPTIIGLIVFTAGMTTTWRDEEVDAICSEHEAPGNYIMCPICAPPNCEPWKMFEEGCHKYKWEYALDNQGTLVLSCLVMFWAILFLKFWKRRESTIASEWKTINFKMHDLTIRPEYEEQAPTTRKNPVTLKIEPHIPVHLRIARISLSIFVTFLVLALAGLALTGLVLSRIALYAAFKKAGGHLAHHNVEYARWFIHLLIFILVTISEKIYNMIVMRLTSIECPRTHHEFMSSLLWKFFVFEIVNECVPIFYAAFLKGKTVMTPIQLNSMTELCDGSCMSEVVELVFVLLTLRLVVGNIIELGLPIIKNCIRRHRNKKHGNHTSMPQWLQDFYLNEVELDGVYEDYMEMMVQFAFIVLFIPAFPLAPLLCLINNIAEIRVDATKMVTINRRPLPARVPGIQIWNKFIDIIIKLGIIVNAALIAFTSEVVPRLYYEYNRRIIDEEDVKNHLPRHKGFTEYSLSYVNVSDWAHELTEEFRHHHDHDHANATIDKCYYIGYRLPNGPDYPHKPDFWRISAVRLVAFAAYAIGFFVIMWLVNTIIPDEPGRIALKVERQAHIAKKHLNEERRKVTRGERRQRSFDFRTRGHAPLNSDDNEYIDYTEDYGAPK